jgi:hypothetical protein
MRYTNLVSEACNQEVCDRPGRENAPGFLLRRRLLQKLPSACSTVALLQLGFVWPKWPDAGHATARAAAIAPLRQ